ncbi:MAG: FAD-dependent oxidoreductase [Bacteroidales bacterium]|nr:FAD-dependent oxidoreductase [Bacteroidales bacterium]
MKHHLTLGLFLAVLSCTPVYDVVVAGGGTGGTATAIEAARDGARTLVVEPTPWLGGMLTAAGVSAVDGNYRLRGGIFGEFTDSLAARYGGYEALKSGWVSHILFNPAVGADVLKNMAGEAGVRVRFGTVPEEIIRRRGGWALRLSDGSTVRARILIDGTELGDVAEKVGAEELRDRVSAQDLTYVAIVKEYDHDVSIPEPEGYDIDLYRSCCDNPLADNRDGLNPYGQQLWSPDMMLSYGRLPDGHLMINWPVFANDYFAEYLDMDAEGRAEVVRKAKLRTLGFIYFLQHELGYRNLGIADDVYPTEDGLPFYPYYREARRIAGKDTMTVEAAKHPYDFDLYTRAVAVGGLSRGPSPRPESPPGGALAPLVREDSFLQRADGRPRPRPRGRLPGRRQGRLHLLGDERRHPSPARHHGPGTGRRCPGGHRREDRAASLWSTRRRSAGRPVGPWLLSPSLPGPQADGPRLPRPAGEGRPRRSPGHRPQRGLGQRNLGQSA